MEGPTTDTDNVQVWLQRTLACVACDGTVDARALAAVEFAHDLHIARTVIASVRANGTSDDVMLSGVRVPNPRKPGKLSTLAVTESPVGSGKWRAYAGFNVPQRSHVMGGRAGARIPRHHESPVQPSRRFGRGSSRRRSTKRRRRVGIQSGDRVVGPPRPRPRCRWYTRARVRCRLAVRPAGVYRRRRAHAGHARDLPGVRCSRHRGPAPARSRRA
ncbi:hypothetical protein pdul_cds_593 [Pandoravirus dulcis]|uniref:Uncharacterized protein n=1 Tax=Pandoravirus dulcis TaxID=1349409 RepID=S4VXT9_9VIRU|nr:hypothetical protein pdul_cds_593 [Pandoravirus dulcis]AGO82714.2 hypothetical protein pdul_cds_593 [Pandoravirus dulcis]